MAATRSCPLKSSGETNRSQRGVSICQFIRTVNSFGLKSSVGASTRILSPFGATSYDAPSADIANSGFGADHCSWLPFAVIATAMLLQSAVLGLGAYLTIIGELTAGAIIACSVASARALAPVDLAIGNWKGFVAARAAYDRLRDTVVALAGAVQPMPAEIFISTAARTAASYLVKPFTDQMDRAFRER